ncbi:DUF1127 domain-containing protein [Pelagibacterium sp. 26DY04]|uniref:DUF1127 domain-containing protein n=1 Tax=Pelagibacterium sp. 26DY04 TaxID=2967130 RepID=UPI002815E88F|nr:DUF1127 domain-containing protein [Pelagibacterium sp. 26DY04]WMT87227.1 DUF1127 domain-containing protein [Pelagibacterium sp. 26DY04]
MPGFLPRALADWLAFHTLYAALRRLDPHLKADLGLSDADLRRLSRKAMHHKGPISIYRLVEEDFEEEAEAVSDPRREDAYGCGEAVRA